MGLHGMLRAQMVKVIEIKETEKGNATVLFNVAGRDKHKNAKGEYESDFYLCRAFGPAADMIIKYFNNTDESGNIIKGKSRKLDLLGHMQSYKTKREESKDKNLKGKQVFDALGMGSQGKYDSAVIPIHYTMKVDVTEWIFMVDRVLFADSQQDDDNIQIGAIDIADDTPGTSDKPKTINIEDDDSSAPISGSTLTQEMLNKALDGNNGLENRFLK